LPDVPDTTVLLLVVAKRKLSEVKLTQLNNPNIRPLHKEMRRKAMP
jgi:hypothetical protein